MNSCVFLVHWLQDSYAHGLIRNHLNKKYRAIYDKLKRYRFFSDITFEHLPKEIADQIKIEAVHRVLKKNEILFNENDAPKGVYILLHGKVKVYQIDQDGVLKILFIYMQGDFFGYQPIVANDVNHASCAAMEDCEYLFIPEHIFRKNLSKSVELSNLLLKNLSSEFGVLFNRYGLFTHKSIKERVALVLLLLCEKSQATYQLTDEVEIKITRSDLASFVGTSLENLVRTLKLFKEDGLVRTDGKSIYILNFEGLYKLSGVN